MRSRWLPAVALFALAAAVAPAVAAQPQPRTTVETIEHEVMCPICGTLLELSESPQAERERVFVARLVAEGRSKDEVKDALVAQYGKEVLALPEKSGFDLSAYLVPVLAILVAMVAVALSVVRWRRRGGGGDSNRGDPRGPAGEDATALDADLSRYDL